MKSIIRRLVIGTILIIASFISLVQAQELNSVEDEIAVKTAVEDYYIKGLQTRDFNLIRNICIREEIMMGVRDNGEMNVTTLDKWSKRFDPENPPFNLLDYVISRIDVEGTAAQVKILFIVNGKTRVTDFLHMLKVKGEWKIVNVIDY